MIHRDHTAHSEVGWCYVSYLNIYAIYVVSKKLRNKAKS
jgi:hypothetical protein